MKVTLANGQEIEALNGIGGKDYVQGTTRETMTLVFPEETSLDAVDELFTEKNCEKIKLGGVFGDAYTYNGYTIRAELTRKPHEVEQATMESEAVVKNLVSITMAQRTYLETQLAQLVVTQAEQDDALIELADMIAEL